MNSNRLTLEQRWALILAFEARNAIEMFHADEGYPQLADSTMPELNYRLRRRLMRAIFILLNAGRNAGCKQKADALLHYVPDYWEIPNLSEQEKIDLKQLWSNGLWHFGARDSEELPQFAHLALQSRERKLVDWYKRLFLKRTPGTDNPDFRISPDEVIKRMKELGFPNRGMPAIIYWGDIYQRAKLRRWVTNTIIAAKEFSLTDENRRRRDQRQLNRMRKQPQVKTT